MDDNTLSGRFKRYAQVSGAVGGLAARLAGEKYLGISIDRPWHAESLKIIFGNLKGPLMKVAQILSTIPDMLPPEYVQELSSLQSNAPSMSWPFVRRRMVGELGGSWPEKFTSFETAACAAASLGQVHKAVSLEGQPLAVKLQYPNMEATVEADLQQLKIAFELYQRFNPAINTQAVYQEICDRLREELDYSLEAHHLKLYQEIIVAQQLSELVHIPRTIPELSTRRLLTMTWLAGQPTLTFKDHPQEIRNQIALNLFKAWYTPFYHYGVIHGDPHLGNYTVRTDHSINLLDFGCIRVFPASFIKGVITLYQARLQQDEALAVHAYEIWGFHNLTKELVDTLNLWADYLYAPLMEDKIRPIDPHHNSAQGRQVANQIYENLRKLGGVKPPREFVFMDRAAVGLGAVFMHLKAELNWYQQFQELIKDFEEDKVRERQEEVITPTLSAG